MQTRGCADADGICTKTNMSPPMVEDIIIMVWVCMKAYRSHCREEKTDLGIQYLLKQHYTSGTKRKSAL